MPSPRFDQARPFATLGLVLAGWLLLPVAAKSLLRAGFFEFTAPIAATASHVRDLQDFWSLRLHSKDELIEAGRDLSRVTASYALAAQRNSELAAEVARLEPLLRVPPVPGYRAEVARVEERDFSGWWQSFVIRKGRNFGITVGAPVVFTGGLVGRVKEVHDYASVVELISSPGVRLAAFIEGDTRPVAFEGGDNPTFGPARGLVEFVPLDVAIPAQAPPRLVTSGLGGVFPPGLTIGQVLQVAPSGDGLFETGTVQLDRRLSELTEVTVLEPDDSAPAVGAP